MNLVKKMTLALAGTAMAFAPIAASAATSAKSLSVSNYYGARTAAATEDDSEFRGGGAIGFILLAIVGAAMIYALIEILDSDDDDQPDSP